MLRSIEFHAKNATRMERLQAGATLEQLSDVTERCLHALMDAVPAVRRVVSAVQCCRRQAQPAQLAAKLL